MSEHVLLKNGAREPKHLVAATRLMLGNLLRKYPVALYELVQVARNPEHEPFGSMGNTLKDEGALEPAGTMHGSIRNIVLSAIEGEEFEEMKLESPLA